MLKSEELLLQRLQEAEHIRVVRFTHKCRVQITHPKIIITPGFDVPFEELETKWPEFWQILQEKGYEDPKKEREQ